MIKSTISTQFVLRKDKRAKAGLFPILLRLTQHRKSIYIRSNYHIKESQWNSKKHQVRSNHPNHKVINDWMSKQLTEISSILLETSENITKEQLKERLTQNKSAQINLLDIYRSFTEALLSDGHYDEAKHASVVIKKLASYKGKNFIALDEVDSAFIVGFQEYLIKELKNGPNTVNKEMQRLKRALVFTKKRGLISHIPYEDYKPLKRTKSRKAKLGLQQIKLLETLELRKGSQKDLARDAFLFAFYNGGIRFGDLCKLCWSDIKDGRLVYQMSKTGTFKDIPLLPKPMGILNKYKQKSHKKTHTLFPIINNAPQLNQAEFNKTKSSKNARFNSVLKKIAEQAGIQESISFHVARHSFADYARTAKIPISDIKNMLGHSSISITQDYLNDLDKQSLDEGMKALFG